MAVTQAKMKSNKKYDLNHYDQVTSRLPKGVKDKIQELGYSVNGFIVEAVNEKLERIEKDGN